MDKLWSLKIIRLCGLLPVSFHNSKFVVSTFWYLWSFIVSIVSIVGTSYRYYYTTVAEAYHSEPNKTGYIFDILLKIEPLVIVTVLFLIQYPVINVLELKKTVNFLNDLCDLFDSNVQEKIVKKDHFITIFVLACLGLWLGALEYCFLAYDDLLDLSRHIDVLLNYLETIIVTGECLKFILNFSMFLIAVNELESAFMFVESSDPCLEICLKKYDILLNHIAQFIKIHGFYVRVLIVYSYFDVVSAVNGFLDVLDPSLGENETKNNTTVADMVTSVWDLCHIPYLLWLIYMGEVIENKVMHLFHGISK